MNEEILIKIIKAIEDINRRLANIEAQLCKDAPYVDPIVYERDYSLNDEK